MADHQRIHPVQVEPVVPDSTAPSYKPTAPLVSRNASRSENGDPEQQHPRGIPYAPPPKRKRSCFRKCCCWTISLLLLLVLILGILAAVVYFVYQPRLPNYSVDSMRITQFHLGNDNSLSASFNVNITARNPNRRIGIYYENGSHLSVWYMGTRLCEGAFPRFYQGHRNTTLLSLMLAGQTQDATGLVQTLQVQQQNGFIPLNLQARVPVRIRLGGLRLMRWNFLVRCRIVVDRLDEVSSIRIRNSSCRFRFRL